MTRHLRTTLPLLVLIGLAPTVLEAQLYKSVGAGVAVPVGDYADSFERGYTVRAQVGFSLTAIGIHAQAGWSRFPAIQSGDVEVADHDIYHLAAGARVGLGLLWVGANAGFFGGDDDHEGLAFLPEVGVGLGPIEGVADFRMGGDTRWLGVRLGIRF